MRIVYYSSTCFLDHVLPQVKVISKLVELHLIVEISPEVWNSSLFDVAPKKLPSGIVSAQSVIQDCFPVGVREYWKNCASFSFVVHNCSRSVHPATWRVSHKAVQFIRSLAPDVIHLDDVSLRLAWALPWLKKIPIVLTIHDTAPHSGEYNWRNKVARWLMFSRTRRFILHNKLCKDSFSEKHGLPVDSVDIIPLGALDIFREWIEDPITEDDRTILFFGRLSKYKGLEVLYEIASELATEISGVRIIVAGKPVPGYDPPLPPEMPNGGHVEVVSEYISNSRLANLFQQATVVVCPYIDATQSGVVLTAYAFDKPVVATSTGGLPEYVKNEITGLLVLPNNAEVLSSALVRILTDRQLRNSLKEGINRIKICELNWTVIGKQTSDVYTSTLQK